jgi:hypothetical protein
VLALIFSIWLNFFCRQRGAINPQVNWISFDATLWYYNFIRQLAIATDKVVDISIAF